MFVVTLVAVEVATFEVVVVAAKTQGVARIAVAMAIAATAVSCAVLVLILSSVRKATSSYLPDFRDVSKIVCESVEEGRMIGSGLIGSDAGMGGERSVGLRGRRPRATSC